MYGVVAIPVSEGRLNDLSWIYNVPLNYYYEQILEKNIDDDFMPTHMICLDEISF